MEFDHLNRREFITLLKSGGCVQHWRAAAKTVAMGKAVGNAQQIIRAYGLMR